VNPLADPVVDQADAANISAAHELVANDGPAAMAVAPARQDLIFIHTL
jgi:hypothetical protein